MDRSGIELSSLQQYYEAWCRSEGMSAYTVSWHREVLRQFHDWLVTEGRPTSLGMLGEAEARGFITSLRERLHRGRPLSGNTVNNRVRALRAFFSWLAREGYTDTHLLANLKPPRPVEKVIETLTQEEINRLFSKLDQNHTLGARHAAELTLLLDAGLRVSELAGLKVQDVHLDSRQVKVFGKGSKERIVSIGTSCQKVLMRYYFNFRGQPAHPGVESFFLTQDGHPVTVSAVQSWMVRLGKATGIKRLHPHLLRHTYCTNFLINGADVFLLKGNLGHTTLTMVERYRHIASRQAALLSQAFSPVDRMNLSQLNRNRGRGNGGERRQDHR